MKLMKTFISFVFVVFISSTFLTACLNKTSLLNDLENEDSDGNISYGNLQLVDLELVSNSNNSGWGEVLNDIISHYMRGGSACMAYTTYASSDNATYAHEATHGLNACIRNNKNNTGGRANAFYLLKGKAAVVPEPNIRKSAVAQYVPNNLRNMGGNVCKDPNPANHVDCRYDKYVLGMSYWDDTPLYIFDEWIAYINGAKEAIGLYKKNQIASNDYGLVHGAIEFMVYASALMKAVSEKDSSSFSSNIQLKALYKYLLKTTSFLYKQGKSNSKLVSSNAETYIENFKKSELFSFIKSNYSDF